MSDTAQERETTRRTKRWSRRLVGPIGCVCVLGALAALMLWAARPRWYTFVSAPTGASPALSLIIRLPVDWECHNAIAAPGIIDLKRKPLVGFARWWRDVLHLDVGQQFHEHYRASVKGIPYEPLMLTEFTKSTQKLFARWGYQTSVEPYTHPLGPACRVTAVRRGTLPYERIEYTCIVPSKHPASETILITAERPEPIAVSYRTKSTWEDLVRSIRVVQK